MENGHTAPGNMLLPLNVMPSGLRRRAARVFLGPSGFASERADHQDDNETSNQPDHTTPMGKVIALANQKGGVAKTTSTMNLAYALVQRGQRVLVVDMDPQSSLTIYCGHDPRDLETRQQTIYWALMKEKDLRDILIPDNPAILPSSIRLASAEPELVTLWDSATVLRDKLAGLKEDYDIILIDCPPSLTLLTVNALAAADAVLIPVKTDYLSVMGIPLLLDTVEKLQKRTNTRLSVLGVLPTLFNSRNIHDNDCLMELKQSLEPRIPVFEPVKRSTGFDRSAAEGKSTLELSPETPGVEVYNSLAETIIAYGNQK
jgi:chromosome partitioning protein